MNTETVARPSSAENRREEEILFERLALKRMQELTENTSPQKPWSLLDGVALMLSAFRPVNLSRATEPGRNPQEMYDWWNKERPLL